MLISWEDLRGDNRLVFLSSHSHLTLKCYILDQGGEIGSFSNTQWLRIAALMQNLWGVILKKNKLESHSNTRVFVRPDLDLLLNFLAAGFDVRLEVKVHHPGVEDEVHGREERFGERRAAIANDVATGKWKEKVSVVTGFALVFTEWIWTEMSQPVFISYNLVRSPHDSSAPCSDPPESL